MLGVSGCGESDGVVDADPVNTGAGEFPMDSGGGTVTYDPPGTTDVSVDITFPAGSVPDGTVITVKETDSFPADPDIDMISGLVFRFGPDGIVFGAPVTLTLTYDPSSLGGATPEDIRIFKTVGSKVEALATTLNDVAHTVSAVLPGFSSAGAGVPSDVTPPVTTAVPAGATFDDCVNVYLTCVDVEGSGCRETYYKTIIDGQETSYTLYDGTPIQLTNGNTAVRFWSYDMYYNQGSVSTENYTVSGCGDAPPTNTTAANFINGGVDSTSTLDLSLGISATDDIGITAYLVQWDSGQAPGAADPDWVTVTATDSYSNTVRYLHPDDSPGLKTIYVFFKDGSGNVSAGASDTITYAPGATPAGVLIDFETLPDGTSWGGGGPVSFQYQDLGVTFSFSDAIQTGGHYCPWVFRLVGGTQPDMHWMTNDRTDAGAKLTGVIHIEFVEAVATPPQVSFLLLFPPALDPVEIEVYDVGGRLLPASVIDRANRRDWGALQLLDITIDWSGGIGEIKVFATRGDVGVDDLSY